MRIALLVATLTGCLQSADGPGVLGSKEDVATAPGTYNGYRVVMPCNNAAAVGVIGSGSVQLATGEDVYSAAADLQARLDDLASIHTWGGSGLACEAGKATYIALNDWREVDTLIERTGAWLSERDFALQVAIDVTSIPVAHSN